MPEIAKRAGRGFVIGETVGAVPYVGKLASKTKAGQAAGKALDEAAEKFAQTKAYDVLMSDIKALNPNKQIAYHGSPADFNKFDNAYIGTGEGAQAHGMGHYAALNKDVADSRYRKRLTTSSKEEVEIDNKYKPLFKEAEKKYDDLINNLYKQKQNGEITEEFYQNAIDNSNEAINVDNILSSWKQEVADLKGKKLTPNEGQLYKLSIPKKDVMLREDLPLSEQSPYVKDKILEIGKFEKTMPVANVDGQAYEKRAGLRFGGWHDSKTGKKVTDENLLNILDNKRKLGDIETKTYQANIFDDSMTGRDIYSRLYDDYIRKDALQPHEILENNGIKGISYNGGIDGEAAVIFNPDDISIVRKYYNQPSLKDLYNRFINSGAYASALTNP